jgi:dTDP-4-dehydrorhamnose 3,5-epimerase
MPFRFERLEIPDVILVEVKSFDDERGFFMETYKASEFGAKGIAHSFLQDNFSRSRRGVFRGLHYQNPPMAQGKLVKVYRGEIVDFAVDIRRGSPTYGQLVSATLSDDNGRMLFVPPGFAHGFCALSDENDVAYKVTAEYSPEHDRGIRWDDPSLGLQLPLGDPLLSDKDAALPLLADADNDFVYHDQPAII